MANHEHLKKLQQGIGTWDRWRDENPDIRPDLSNANLAGANLIRMNLAGVSLTGANLVGTALVGADLAGADLGGANLAGADLVRSNLAGANLSKTNLTEANLTGANLVGVNFDRANLLRSRLDGAKLNEIRDSKLQLDEARNSDEWHLHGTWINEINDQADKTGWPGLADLPPIHATPIQVPIGVSKGDETGEDNTEVEKALAGVQLHNANGARVNHKEKRL